MSEFQHIFQSTGLPPQKIRKGIRAETIVAASCVLSVNILRDLHNKLRNLLGGELKSYSTTLENAVEIALDRLMKKVKEGGWDGVHSIKIANPDVADGASEVMVIGTAFR